MVYHLTMDDIDVVETRKITVKDGQVLEVEMSQKFIERLRQHFVLSTEEPLEDEHVKLYVFGAMNTAVNKAENEQTTTRV